MLKNKLLFAKSIVYKRAGYFLDFFEKAEEEVYKSLLEATDNSKLEDIEKKRIIFPNILLPRKEIPLEWWYFTGHLNSGKNRFGFEFCIFKLHPKALRFGFIPLSFVKKEPFLICHIAITDKNKKTFFSYQNSGIIDSDTIEYGKLDLSLDKSRIVFSKNFKINSEFINLNLKPIKKIVKHFEHGYGLTYEKPKHKTYYVTFPRLVAKGSIKLKGKKYNVSGLAWFDHQKCNLPHMTPVVGWDWFSILFDDNTELMFFRLRDKKGISEKHLGGSFIDRDGKLTKLLPKDVVLSSISEWKSQKTGIVYPSGWVMQVPKLDISIKILPCVNEQEMDTILTSMTSYWEDACDVSGTKSGNKIKGQSYVELVGYDKRIISRFIWKSVQ